MKEISDDINKYDNLLVNKTNSTINKTITSKGLSSNFDVTFSNFEGSKQFSINKNTANNYTLNNADINSLKFSNSSLNSMSNLPSELSSNNEDKLNYLFSKSISTNKSSINKIESIDKL